MEAIEFQTTLGKEGIISIPDNVSQQLPRGRVRVIVLSEEKTPVTPHDKYAGAKGYIKYLMENPIKLDKSTPFLAREEIHDRKI